MHEYGTGHFFPITSRIELQSQRIMWIALIPSGLVMKSRNPPRRNVGEGIRLKLSICGYALSDPCKEVFGPDVKRPF